MKEYLLISEEGNLYKIISKVLVYRLKKVLRKVIDKAQSTFLVGRNLLDSISLQMKFFIGHCKKNYLIMKVNYKK